MKVTLLWICILLAIILTGDSQIVTITDPTEGEVIENEATIPEVTMPYYGMVELIRTEPASLEEVEIALAATTDRITAAAAIYENFLALGYSEEHPGAQLALGELTRAESDYEYYKQCGEQIKWQIRYEEYPVATQVWRYMSETLGWSDEVCAGVMGNMMAECGGHTLNLQWDIGDGKYYYGLCQWARKYNPTVWQASLEEQLAYLGTTVPIIFDGWAGKGSGYTYETFLQIGTCEEAAKAFSDVYERPGRFDRRRAKLALKAYNYFVN